MNNLPAAGQLIASAAQFLIEGGDEDAASILLSCDVEQMYTVDENLIFGNAGVVLNLRGPRVAYDCLNDHQHNIYRKVWDSLNAPLPHGWELRELNIRGVVVRNLDPDWHSELLELARGKSVNNQATADASRLWNGLRFRSLTEVRIAEALDRAGVLFFPLCRGRLNGETGRVVREPDFLVCKDGKWGILEVDGEPYHPPSRTVHDHARDALFQQHGVQFVQHRDSDDCYMTPDKVVAEFLTLLDRYY
jgi:hypothetical protein